MKRLSGRELKALLVLSIVVPIGLLATFRLTGILPAPLVIAETITADTVQWNISRPSYFLSIEDRVVNTYINSAFSGSLTIYPTSYWENDGMLDYNDGLWFRFVADANTSTGFIYSMNIKSLETDEYAVLDFVEHFSNSIKLKNLMQKKISDGSHFSRAVLETISIGQPKECALKLKPLWKFFDLNSVDHWITVTLEVTYFNGAIYRQVNLPIRLGVIMS